MDQAGGVRFGQAFRNRLDMNMRVQRAQGLRAGLHLGAADIDGGEGDLALKVRQGDGVVIDQPQDANPRRCQIKRRRRADPAKADQGDARGLQPLLPRSAHLGKHQMAGVALDFVV